jgi:hypothetical protein
MSSFEFCAGEFVDDTDGLYLVEPIDMDKLFKPSSELKKYIENGRQKKQIY